MAVKKSERKNNNKGISQQLLNNLVATSQEGKKGKEWNDSGKAIAVSRDQTGGGWGVGETRDGY